MYELKNIFYAGIISSKQRHWANSQVLINSLLLFFDTEFYGRAHNRTFIRLINEDVKQIDAGM